MSFTNQPLQYVSNVEDVVRGEIAGFNRMKTGKFEELIPRLSRADHAELLLARNTEVPQELDLLLSRFRKMSEADRTLFRDTKRMVAYEVDGREERTLVANVPSARDDIEMDPDPPPQNLITLEGRAKGRTYTLTSVFNDISVLDKYRISPRQFQTAARMAVSQPAAAARFLEDVVNSSQTAVAVTITAGSHARGKTRARQAVKTVCRGMKATEAVIGSCVIGTELFMFGPGCDDTTGWHVRGPLENAYQVYDIHRALQEQTPQDVVMLLGLELVQLGINISVDGIVYSIPPVIPHVGGLNVVIQGGVAIDTASMLTSKQRSELESMTDRLLPVMVSSGCQVATAVRVTDRHVLINSHVVDSDPTCSVADMPVKVHRLVARDVWSALCPGTAKPWVMRRPVPGESVAIAYRAGDGVACSSPLRVVSIEGLTIVTTKASDVISGTSGGALFSLTDMALLGVHSAETTRNLIAYAFSGDQFAELLEGDEVSTISRDSGGDTTASLAMARFKKRGLGQVMSAAISSMLPAYIGPKHVGMAVSLDGWLYTTCNADLPLRLGSDKKALTFESVDGGLLYRTANVFPGLGTPIYRRAPRYFEKVYVVGFDASSPYFSVETTVAHVGVNSRSFILADMVGVELPLTGGLVIGKDGAVLGLCGVQSMTTVVGSGFLCYVVPAVEGSGPVDIAKVLTHRFPFLNLAAWGPDLFEEIVVHASVGSYASGVTFNAGCRPLANVGDNAAKAALYSVLRARRVPHPKWSGVMQDLQSNANYAEVAWRSGFAQCLKVGPGVELPRGSRAYADMVEAVLGAAYLIEMPHVFVELCLAMGVIPAAEDGLLVDTPVDTRSRF